MASQSAKSKVAKKPKVAKTPAQHPPYGIMIKAAIAALKDRKGASKQAIVKYVSAKYKVGTNCNKQVNLQLKRMVQNKALTQPTGSGASGRFKINKATEDAKAKKAAALAKKKAAAAATKKKAAAVKQKVSVAKKTAAAKKKTAAKRKKSASPKKAAKKQTTKKTVTKKPAAKKSVKKSPSKKSSAKKPASKKSPKKSVKKAAKKKWNMTLSRQTLFCNCFRFGFALRWQIPSGKTFATL